MVNVIFDLFRRIDHEKYPAPDLPEYPCSVLLRHLLLKNLQVGATISVVGAVIHAWWHKTSIADAIAGECGGSTLIATSSVLFVPCILKVSSLNSDGVDDRAYRLLHNYSQQWHDYFALLGGTIGALINLYAFRRKVRTDPESARIESHKLSKSHSLSASRLLVPRYRAPARRVLSGFALGIVAGLTVSFLLATLGLIIPREPLRRIAPQATPHTSLASQPASSPSSSPTPHTAPPGIPPPDAPAPHSTPTDAPLTSPTGATVLVT